MSTLYRAVPLEEMDGVSVIVGEDLYLDVPGTQNRLLDEHRVVTKRELRFAHGRSQSIRKRFRGLNPAHTAATTTSDSLDENREPDPIGLRHEVVHVRRRL